MLFLQVISAILEISALVMAITAGIGAHTYEVYINRFIRKYLILSAVLTAASTLLAPDTIGMMQMAQWVGGGHVSGVIFFTIIVLVLVIAGGGYVAGRFFLNPDKVKKLMNRFEKQRPRR